MSTEGLGKYVRYVLAVSISWLVTTLVGLAGVELPDGQISGFVDGLVSLLLPVVMFAVAMIVKEFLKRFPWLDMEGYASRVGRKQKASAIKAGLDRPYAR